jgi:hypothetical protein
MTSLAEAYEGTVGEAASVRRLGLGVGLVVAGAVLTVVGVVVATTDLAAMVGLDRTAAWRRAGLLAGVGVPAMIGGVFGVLPSSRRIKAAASIGASVSVFGVALFWYAYPAHWAGFGRDLTLAVSAVYCFGMLTTVWCLFVGIANFKQRNDPGGTVSLRLSQNGETKIVEVDRSEVDLDGDVPETGIGGVGMFGATPDGDVETQTNAPEEAPTGSVPESGGTTGYTTSSSGPSTTGPTEPSPAPPQVDAAGKAASDGGADDRDIRSVGPGEGSELVSTTESARRYADRYCGNCEHFQYVRGENGMQPYCGHHGEAMTDMEACEEWTPNH